MSLPCSPLLNRGWCQIASVQVGDDAARSARASAPAGGRAQPPTWAQSESRTTTCHVPSSYEYQSSPSWSRRAEVRLVPAAPASSQSWLPRPANASGPGAGPRSGVAVGELRGRAVLVGVVAEREDDARHPGEQAAVASSSSARRGRCRRRRRGSGRRRPRGRRQGGRRTAAARCRRDSDAPAPTATSPATGVAAGDEAGDTDEPRSPSERRTSDPPSSDGRPGRRTRREHDPARQRPWILARCRSRFRCARSVGAGARPGRPAASVAGLPRGALARSAGSSRSEQPVEVLRGVGDEVDVERADPLLEHAPHRLAEVGDRAHQRQPREALRLGPCRRRRRAARRPRRRSRSWLIEKLPRSKNGSPIPAYSQSTIRIRAPSSMKLAFSRSLWQGRISSGFVRQRELDPARDGLRQLVLGRDRDAARRGERPVRLDDPERDEQPGDRRPVVDPSQRVRDPRERRRPVDGLVRHRRAVDEPGHEIALGPEERDRPRGRRPRRRPRPSRRAPPRG